MSNGKPYFRGLPTELDVRALRDAFGVPAIGQPIPYEKVAEIIKTPVSACRFKTVTNVWRRGLFKVHNCFLGAGNGAFTALDSKARVKETGRKIDSGIGSVRRGGRLGATTERDGLAEIDVKELDHQLGRAATHDQHDRRLRSQFKASAPPALTAAR
jgi:hypothetical protein